MLEVENVAVSVWTMKNSAMENALVEWCHVVTLNVLDKLVVMAAQHIRNKIALLMERQHAYLAMPRVEISVPQVH